MRKKALTIEIENNMLEVGSFLDPVFVVDMMGVAVNDFQFNFEGQSCACEIVFVTATTSVLVETLQTTTDH